MTKNRLFFLAMLRPTHLLCLAMNKEYVSTTNKTGLELVGLVVKKIT